MKYLTLFDDHTNFNIDESLDVWVSYDNEHVHYSASYVKEYEYVDLGLPSGLLWTTCNVGANSPQESGLYFQWGDTVGYEGDDAKAHSTWPTTPYQTNNTVTTWDDYDKVKLTKYLGSTSSSFKDPSATDADALKTILDLSDDAVHAHMGGDWRMPTKEDFIELTNNTTFEWITNYNGSNVNGGLFTSKTNSNTLFVPASGGFGNGMLNDEGYIGYLRSSSVDVEDPRNTWILYFDDSEDLYIGSGFRFAGLPVYGVRSK